MALVILLTLLCLSCKVTLANSAMLANVSTVFISCFLIFLGSNMFSILMNRVSGSIQFLLMHQRLSIFISISRFLLFFISLCSTLNIQIYLDSINDCLFLHTGALFSTAKPIFILNSAIAQ